MNKFFTTFLTIVSLSCAAYAASEDAAALDERKGAKVGVVMAEKDQKVNLLHQMVEHTRQVDINKPTDFTACTLTPFHKPMGSVPDPRLTMFLTHRFEQQDVLPKQDDEYKLRKALKDAEELDYQGIGIVMATAELTEAEAKSLVTQTDVLTLRHYDLKRIFQAHYTVLTSFEKGQQKKVIHLRSDFMRVMDIYGCFSQAFLEATVNILTTQFSIGDHKPLIVCSAQEKSPSMAQSVFESLGFKAGNSQCKVFLEGVTEKDIFSPEKGQAPNGKFKRYGTNYGLYLGDLKNVPKDLWS